MKVSSSSGVSQASGARSPSRPAAGGFLVGGAAPAQEAAPSARVAGASPVNSIDALLALQSVGTPLERRKRAVGRAGRILDLLDDVKVSLLEGSLSPSAL